MTALSLLAPLGLAALLGLAIVVIAHLRHPSPRRATVPTVRFWEVAQRTLPPERDLPRRPPISLLLILHLLVAASLAFALARPAADVAFASLTSRTEALHLIILLDGSSSMAATDAAGTPSWDTARTVVADRVERLGSRDSVTLIILGTTLTSSTASSRDAMAALRTRLQTLPLPGGIANLDAGARLAANLRLPGIRDRVLVVTDGRTGLDPTLVRNLGTSVELVNLGDPAATNLAITTIATQPLDPATHRPRLFVRVVNYGPARVTATINVQAQTIAVASDTITVDPNGGSRDLEWLLPSNVTAATVELAHKDAWPEDNRAEISFDPASPTGLRILLVSDAPGALARALSILPGATLSILPTDSSPGEIDAEPIDLAVYESTNPRAEDLPAAPVLFVNPLDSGYLTVTGTLANPVAATTQPSSPLLTGVDLAGVIFGDAPAVTLPEDWVAAISDPNGPLLASGNLPGGQPSVLAAFDVERSNLPRRVTFPILVANIVTSLVPQQLPAAISAGDVITFHPRAGATTLTITDPANLSTILPADGNAVIFSGTGGSGRYVVLQQDQTGATLSRGSIAANAGHATESDLRPNPDLPAAVANAQDTEQSRNSANLADLWPLLALVALLLLLAEAAVTSLFRPTRRIGAFSDA